MDDAVPLRAGERGEQPLEHLEDLGQREAAHERTQRPTLEMLHCDVRRSVVLEVVVDGDDVRMRQPRRQLRFPQESRGGCLVADLDTHELLQRHELVQCRVTREVDHGVRAAPDLADDLVTIERRCRVQGATAPGEGAPLSVFRRATSSCRDWTSSFRKILCKWYSIVFGLRNRFCAACR